MIFQCHEGKCSITNWMRVVLVTSGFYHLAFALWSILCPAQALDWFDCKAHGQPLLWQMFGVISAILGLGLIIISKNPIRHWPIVLLGFIESIVAIIVVGTAVFNGELSSAALIVLAVNDVVWLPFFGLILWAALRAHTGIPASRNEPYSIEEAASIYQLSDGRKLADASIEAPLVLVFLRHFGCTFTRQILRGLQDLELQAKQHNATLVLVHMLQSGKEIDYLGQNSDVVRIADPRCELYRSFGLGKGGFLELFGPHVWWRGAIAIFKGCGIGHLAGDGLQMPGAYVFHQGKIIASQPAQSAADLPNLEALFAGKTYLANTAARG
jgi:hypothetical protein